MRGFDEDGKAAFAYVSCEARVPADHPLRTIRTIVDEALKGAFDQGLHALAIGARAPGE